MPTAFLGCCAAVQAFEVGIDLFLCSRLNTMSEAEIMAMLYRLHSYMNVPLLDLGLKSSPQFLRVHKSTCPNLAFSAPRARIPLSRTAPFVGGALPAVLATWRMFLRSIEEDALHMRTLSAVLEAICHHRDANLREFANAIADLCLTAEPGTLLGTVFETREEFGSWYSFVQDFVDTQGVPVPAGSMMADLERLVSLFQQDDSPPIAGPSSLTPCQRRIRSLSLIPSIAVALPGLPPSTHSQEEEEEVIDELVDEESRGVGNPRLGKFILFLDVIALERATPNFHASSELQRGISERARLGLRHTYKSRQWRKIFGQNSFSLFYHALSFYHSLIMSIPQNALPAAVKLRESALTAFKTYQDMKEGLNSAAALTILGVAANYCVQLIDTKDPCLLMHQPMHNVLFLVRGEYNTRSTGVHAIAPPADLDTIKEYCRAVLAARATAQVVPPPVTAQAQAQAEIAEHGYILKQRPRKLVKSKAVVEDKDDEVEIVPGPSDTDIMMGGCDGPNAITAADTMAVDNLFGDEEVKDAASSPKEKGKKRAASGPKTPAKSKRAETVSIPYNTVPGMDTNSREFHKALVVEHAKGSCAGDKCPRTEPPFISGLADLQSRQNESANSLLIDNPLYREILARAHAAVTNRMPAYPTLAYFKQQEVDLHERVLLSMQRLDLELCLRDVLVADYEIALAQIAEREVTKE
ncbi:uncharacterized protein LACBIDRAFT_322521 [Laccaria bicolor S238N-H82]|uniref:Predicted protein n=1 Tax=Laccaria bicolor (strain S238N-H82 / ATCC MYA-4686) TaxID=486041 RepID=B0CWK8_LACBS|nr:uncharacterized protein LACBIDRAFT_322521 [Laccaria bicolor S238N-H82]EDR13529.1 predicted protein [Laccaria bicolor S238N-H82]|eukprot:XP_001876027.1 predicted protein [Laccaria bicolor S238N-H82]